MTFDVLMLINKKATTHTKKYPSHAPKKIEHTHAKQHVFCESIQNRERGRTKKSTTVTTYFHIHHGTDAKSIDGEAGTFLRWQEHHLQISCQEEASSPSPHQ